MPSELVKNRIFVFHNAPTARIDFLWMILKFVWFKKIENKNLFGIRKLKIKWIINVGNSRKFIFLGK